MMKRKMHCTINYLKLKRDETSKVRQCADGRKQQEHMLEEESASLTVSTEGYL